MHTTYRVGFSLCLSLSLGCDLAQKSLGDGGAAADESGDDSAADETGKPGQSSGGNGGTDGGGNDDTPVADASTTGANGGACTEIGCTSGLSVTLTGNGFFPGTYYVTWNESTEDDIAESCLFVVENGELGLDGELGTNNCTITNIAAGEVVVLLPILSTPSITVSFQDDVIGTLTQAVDYETSQPNGPGCEPICMSSGLILPVADVPFSGGFAACEVDGQVYPHGSSVPDPYSCNGCLCDDGTPTACTEIGCSEQCPPGTSPGQECVACGPTDACEVIHTGCLPECLTTEDCEVGECLGGGQNGNPLVCLTMICG